MKKILNVKMDHLENQDPDIDNWWNLEGQELAKQMWLAIDGVNSLINRRRINTRNAILYEDVFDGRELAGYPYSFGTVPSHRSRIGYNVIKSVIDTVHSKITKNKPKVQYLTDGGNYNQRTKAKNLTKYVNASFLDIGFYKNNALAFRDCGVFGTGFVKFYKDPIGKKIRCERVVTDEIIVDDDDGMYGTPDCLYQVRYVNRYILKKQYPEYSNEIDASQSITVSSRKQTDLVEIAEGWKLSEVKKGRHVICLKQLVLFDEKYEENYFPFVVTRWSNPLYGYFGLGICDELVDIQQEIDRLLKNISKAINLIAIPTWWVPNGSNVSSQQIGNRIGQIISYDEGRTGSPPKPFTPTAMNPEVYNHLKWLIQSAYEKTGVSQLSAQSAKPSGLNAAVALRTVQDIETERFYSVADNYQQTYIDAGKIIIALSKSLDADLKKNGETGLIVKGISDDNMESIKWSDCNLEENRYIMQGWPVNLLPDRPEGKIQAVTELIKTGVISANKAHSLLPYPDIQAEISIEFAPQILIDKILDRILVDGIYQQPEPHFDLNYAMISAPKYYNQGKVENAPEEHLMKILLFMDDTERLLELSTTDPQLPQNENVDPNLNAEMDLTQLNNAPIPPTLPNQIEQQGLTPEGQV